MSSLSSQDALSPENQLLNNFPLLSLITLDSSTFNLVPSFRRKLQVNQSAESAVPYSPNFIKNNLLVNREFHPSFYCQPSLQLATIDSRPTLKIHPSEPFAWLPVAPIPPPGATSEGAPCTPGLEPRPPLPAAILPPLGP